MEENIKLMDHSLKIPQKILKNCYGSTQVDTEENTKLTDHSLVMSPFEIEKMLELKTNEYGRKY